MDHQSHPLQNSAMCCKINQHNEDNMGSHFLKVQTLVMTLSFKDSILTLPAQRYPVGLMLMHHWVSISEGVIRPKPMNRHAHTYACIKVNRSAYPPGGGVFVKKK